MSTIAQSSPAIAPHRFAFGYHRQTWWNWRIGAAFFCGEIGAGLFLVSLLTGHFVGLLVGYLIVVAGKNTAHLLYLGRPARFWRAAMRPDRSWIARGIWATAIFGIFGAASLAARAHSVSLPSSVTSVSDILAGCAALFIMFYDGLVMKASSGIRFWNSFFLPVLCLTYALLGGATLELTLREFAGQPTIGPLSNLEHLLLMLNAVLLVAYITRMSQSEPAAKETVHLLIEGRYHWAFVGLVIVVGIVGVFLFSILHKQFQSDWLLMLVALCELAGDFTLVMVLLKSGLCSPQTAPKYSAALR